MESTDAFRDVDAIYCLAGAKAAHADRNRWIYPESLLYNSAKVGEVLGRVAVDVTRPLSTKEEGSLKGRKTIEEKRL
jgi:hypothetical protein